MVTRLGKQWTLLLYYLYSVSALLLPLANRNAQLERTLCIFGERRTTTKMSVSEGSSRVNKVVEIKRWEKGRFQGKDQRIQVHEIEENHSEESGSEWEGTPHLLSDVGTYSSEEFPPQCPWQMVSGAVIPILFHIMAQIENNTCLTLGWMDKAAHKWRWPPLGTQA